MLVSIIIPVYNTKTEDLMQCTESILQQTYTDFEILFIDDGSGIACALELDRIAQMDQRIRVIHKKNEGVSVARNFGINNAKGEYILFVDGDDLLTPWLIESGLEAMTVCQADVVIGRILTTNQRGMQNISRPHNPATYVIEKEADKDLFEAHVLAKNHSAWQRDESGWEYNFEGCWAHLLKRNVAIKNPFVPGLEVGEDTLWAVSMIENEDCPRICLIDTPWYYYIQNPYSVMNKYNPRIVKQLTAPVSILTPILYNRTGSVFEAYIDWILIKLKQISYRFVLAPEANLTDSEKKAFMQEMVKTQPWQRLMKDRKDLNFKVRIKLFLYRHGLMIKIYERKR